MVRIVSALILSCLVAACSEKQPTAPPVPPPPDTTSHDWEFTMYEVGGLSSTLEDVSALSPDYAIAVGKMQETGGLPRINSYLWNGISLHPMNLPIYANDTVTIDPQNHPNTRIGETLLNAVWAFRRDNIWYSTDGAIAHLTIRGRDTSVRQETWKTIGIEKAFSGTRIWANDTNEIYFAGLYSSVVKFANGEWIPMHAGTEYEKAEDLFGTGKALFLVTSRYPESSFKMFRDGMWRTIWKIDDPSLSNSVEFGRPNALWGNPGEDSVWLAGLWLGRYSKMGTGLVTPLFDIHRHGYTKIRGISLNDVFFAGADGLITHYNGNTFHDFIDYMDQEIRFLSLSVVQDHVFIVGYRRWGGGVFIHGKRTR